jgi:alkylhydroperoxidase/carboxymuconolactone decarboxylase family protein YurZ
MEPAAAPGVLAVIDRQKHLGQAAEFQETLRRLAMIHEGFVEDAAGLNLGLDRTRFLDAKTAALLPVAAAVAGGSPAVCLEWSTGRALAAGATDDEIADVLLAIAPVTGLGPVVAAAAEVAAALGYDIQTALEDPTADEPLWSAGHPLHGAGRLQGGPGAVPDTCPTGSATRATHGQ